MNEGCRCFWWDKDPGTCAHGEDYPVQETCPFHAYRINPMTGEAWPLLDEPPKNSALEGRQRRKA